MHLLSEVDLALQRFEYHIVAAAIEIEKDNVGTATQRRVGRALIIKKEGSFFIGSGTVSLILFTFFYPHG